MNTATPSLPRILILESDRKTCTMVREYALKGFRGASVQTTSAALADFARDPAKLKGFDVVLAGCDFSADGSAAEPVLRALRAISAAPGNPPVILLTEAGSEYTAIQAARAGAFDCIPRHLLGREKLLGSVAEALAGAGGGGELAHRAGFFGYTIGQRLARRDNVSVHVAYSAERSEHVVLKVLHRGRGSLARDENFGRFVEEFTLLYDIEDPAVADIYDFRVTREYCYIVMEYFSRGHLGGRLGKPLDVDDALRTAARIAVALSIVHAAGVVHRDLKPANVMLRDDGSLALIDFGIAQSAAVTGSLDSSRSVITGTPYYMSPEQARGDPTDERTDLYALGIILFQMLTGEKPFVAESAQAILEQHCNAPIPKLPAPLEHLQPLLDIMLAKDARHRISSARELTEAIDEARAFSREREYRLA
ncbi:MAG: protein kinase [Gammaproteobacteria bacterium]|nr:protein kinase [Gammaproteobacteria bacterium]